MEAELISVFALNGREEGNGGLKNNCFILG